MDYAVDSKTFDIFRNVFAFFGTLSPHGYVLTLDGGIFEKTTTDPQLLVGQKFSETVYWQSSEHTAENLERAISDAATNNSKAFLDFRVNAEEKIFIELFLQPIFNQENRLEHIFFCAQDVTDREREIEYHKNRSEQLLFAAENADIGLWFWDLVEDAIFTTPKCNELFEVALHDTITLRSFLKIVHPDDRLRVKAALEESQKNGMEYKVEYRVIFSDGNLHWLAVKGKTFLDDEGKPKNMMGVVREITDKKLANEELAKVYAREKQTRDEAEEANRAKDFFLAVVSHELRSPLNTILGWTKILLTKEIGADVRKNALETIEKSARAQSKLIDDLVDTARVSSGKLRLELHPLNLFEVLKTVYNSQKPLTDAKNVNLEFSVDAENIPVFGDAVRLRQIFTNLVSNALKFTSAGCAIKIIAKIGEKDVKVFIEDNGQGINPESLPNIFRQFQQGEQNSSTAAGGLGLGLSIVKILSEKHSGRVEVESEGIGCGSTFTVTLPLCGYENAAVNKPEVEKKAVKNGRLLTGVKILIVEDDPDSREVLQLFLEQNGAKIESVESAGDALSLLRQTNGSFPDVIVSDLAMPNEDGYSMMTRIRDLPPEKGGAIPAIALSAFASVANKQQASKAGFQKYHTKPFEPDVIVQDILNLVKNNL